MMENSKQQILFEIIKLGNSVKVTAIDPITHLEASIVAPANYSEYTLKIQAMRKLNSLFKKKI